MEDIINLNSVSRGLGQNKDVECDRLEYTDFLSSPLAGTLPDSKLSKTQKTAQIASRLVPVTALLVRELCLGFLVLMSRVPEIAYIHRPT